MLAESQLIGGHAEYYVLCGPGVPSLRSLWGAIRNRQLYILRMYCKGCISFNFSIFFKVYMTYRTKKNFHALTAKRNNSIFFYNLHDLPQKKITRIYRKKKLHDWTIFSYTTYIFHIRNGLQSQSPGNPREKSGNSQPGTTVLGFWV